MNKVLSYKKKLIEKLGDLHHAKILEYGCGSGEFIELLVGSNHQPKEIVAADSDKAMIAKISDNFSKEISEGIVTPILVDNPANLTNHKFDKIICHNVLECVNDKVEFINSFSAIMNIGATFILPHHDFDSAIYNSRYKEFSRNLVHHFSDTQQVWQKHSDGQIGRKIPSLISQSVFREKSRWFTWRLVDTEFKPETYGFLMASMLMEIGIDTFKDADIQAWHDDLTQKSELGEYYFAIDLVVCICDRE